MNNLPILHPATNPCFPEVVLNLNGQEQDYPSVDIEIDFEKMYDRGSQPFSVKAELLIARAISSQAMLIGWWLAKQYQLDVHPTAPWFVSRQFKVVGHHNYALSAELRKLSLDSYTFGKCNDVPALIKL